MKVDGLDIDTGVEGVLIEETRTACLMGHVKATSENVTFLQFVVRSIFFSPTVSSLPVRDAESPLHN